MKRYIRFKDNTFTDTTDWDTSCINKDFVIKDADTIEELIDVGDLIIYKEDYVKPRAYIIYNEASLYVYAKLRIENIFELYTKQGNNYILVARKENGKWRVI